MLRWLAVPPDDDAVRGVLTDLARRRGRGATFCPSEAARVLSTDWRPLMPQVRRVAGVMQAEGLLWATQGGLPVDPEAAVGPIRLGLA